MSAGADTKANNGSGALKIRDLRLLEDGSECGGALVSDVVAVETAKHGRGPGGERPGVSMGADTKANTLRGSGALQRCECHRRGQQLAQHDRSRYADAVVIQVELRDAVLAQGG